MKKVNTLSVVVSPLERNLNIKITFIQRMALLGMASMGLPIGIGHGTFLYYGE